MSSIEPQPQDDAPEGAKSEEPQPAEVSPRYFTIGVSSVGGPDRLRPRDIVIDVDRLGDEEKEIAE